MARTVRNKELIHTKLAANYGGWMYCTECGENIGYLCYATYDRVNLRYQCNCGSCGSATLDFEDSAPDHVCGEHLITIKNRLCCPLENSPLVTLLSKKLKSYELEITCKACGNRYHETMPFEED